MLTVSPPGQLGQSSGGRVALSRLGAAGRLLDSLRVSRWAALVVRELMGGWMWLKGGHVAATADGGWLQGSNCGLLLDGLLGQPPIPKQTH